MDGPSRPIIPAQVPGNDPGHGAASGRPESLAHDPRIVGESCAARANTCCPTRTPTSARSWVFPPGSPSCSSSSRSHGQVGPRSFSCGSRSGSDRPRQAASAGLRPARRFGRDVVSVSTAPRGLGGLWSRPDSTARSLCGTQSRISLIQAIAARSGRGPSDQRGASLLTATDPERIVQPWSTTAP